MIFNFNRVTERSIECERRDEQLVKPDQGTEIDANFCFDRNQVTQFKVKDNGKTMTIACEYKMRL